MDVSFIANPQGVKIADPIQQYGQAATLKQLLLQNQAAQQTMDDTANLNQVYAGAVRPDGKVDRQAILSGAAQRGLGSKIPGIQKGFLESDKAEADLNSTRATTAKTTQQALFEGFQHVNSTISSLLSDPQINDNKVYMAMGNLVNTGAMDIQAKLMNTTPDALAMKILQSMPKGDPVALRQWLIQTGMRNMDASKRVEMSLPKYDEQDRGGTINQGTINPMTGIRTPVTDVQKTATPGDLLKANTDSTQVVTDATGGVNLVDKRTSLSTPVVNAGNRQPLESADSPQVKNRKMIGNLTEGIKMARTLLKAGPTASGAGAMIDNMMAFTGNSTKGADLASSLKTLSGWLTANVPRMEGPQSNMDVATYQLMAADVGNERLPIDRRLQALDTLEQLMLKYSTGTPPTQMPTPRVPGAGRLPSTGNSGSAAVDINSFFLKPNQ